MCLLNDACSGDMEWCAGFAVWKDEVASEELGGVLGNFCVSVGTDGEPGK